MEDVETNQLSSSPASAPSMLSLEDYREAHMRAALDAARTALETGEVAVGCVLVDRATNCIVASGHNTTHVDGHALCHAEFNAVEKLQQRFLSTDSSSETTTPPSSLASLQQYILYVTVEPCIMCASFLKYNKIFGVFFGCTNPRFGGNGTVLAVHSMMEDGIPTYPSYGGFLKDEAIALLQTFYSQENDSAPEHKRRRKEVSFDTAA